MRDDFFVSYLPTSPSVARWIRSTVLSLIFAAAVLGITLGLLQSRYAHSVFEFGQDRTFEGFILERPYPLLIVPRPGEAQSEVASFSTYLLVDPFKHGADGHIRGLAGRHVRLQGELIYRDGQTMLELKPGEIQTLASPSQFASPVMKDLGAVTVSGEIVDAKCFLGVMNPGAGKVHRDCAARCISGGVPAALIATDADHSGSVYLLQTSDGMRLPAELLARVGEHLTLHGQALQMGDQLVLILHGRP